VVPEDDDPDPVVAARAVITAMANGPIAHRPPRPAQRTTTSFPIVFALADEPVELLGVVASVAKPGGNITGLAGRMPELTANRLMLPNEALPTATRAAAVSVPRRSAEGDRRPQVTALRRGCMRSRQTNRQTWIVPSSA
jgi:hypothetical protein